MLRPHTYHVDLNTVVERQLPPDTAAIKLNQVLYEVKDGKTKRFMCLLCKTTGKHRSPYTTLRHLDSCTIFQRCKLALFCPCGTEGCCIFYTVNALVIHQRIHGFGFHGHDTYVIRHFETRARLVAYDAVESTIFWEYTAYLISKLIPQTAAKKLRKTIEQYSNSVVRNLRAYYGASQGRLMHRDSITKRPDQPAYTQMIYAETQDPNYQPTTAQCPFTGLMIQPYVTFNEDIELSDPGVRVGTKTDAKGIRTVRKALVPVDLKEIAQGCGILDSDDED